MILEHSFHQMVYPNHHLVDSSCSQQHDRTSAVWYPLTVEDAVLAVSALVWPWY